MNEYIIMNPKRTHGTQTYLTLQWFAPVSLGQGRCLLSSTPNHGSWRRCLVPIVRGFDPRPRSVDAFDGALCVPCGGEKNVSVSESESVGMHVGPFGLRRASRAFRFVCFCFSHPLPRQDRTARRTRGWSAIVSTVCTGERGGSF